MVRNRLRLPHPVKTDLRICVIAAPGSKAAAEAREAGAAIVGEDEVFERVREGEIDFDRCICHSQSITKLNKSGLGRLLGPKGLMPSMKTGTVVSNVGSAVRDMVGASEYRERMGVVRMAVGQLKYTPEELQTNIVAFMTSVKKDMAQMNDRISKEIHEVVRVPPCSTGGGAAAGGFLGEILCANDAAGSQFDTRARFPVDRRIQRRRFNSAQGDLGPSVKKK